MQFSIHRRSRNFLAGFSMTAALVLAGPIASAASATVPVFPPNSMPYGMSYGAWSAAWWQHTMAGGTAPFAEGSVNCSDLGTSHVVFLVGTTGGSVSRSCTVTPGRALLIPLVNAECSTLQGDGTTEQELQACAAGLADSIDKTSLHASVDGQALTGLAGFRFDSGLFTFTSSGNNVFAVPAGTTNSVADGYWIMLPPLTRGAHIVDFGGGVGCENGSCAFTTDATYMLTSK